MDHNGTSSDHYDNAWQTVSRRKKNRRHQSNSPENISGRHDANTQVPGDSVCVVDINRIARYPGNEEIKKVKFEKPKTPNIMGAETAAEMDADHLSFYLIDVAVINERRQLMRFADYFGNAFSSVNSSQFPWLEIFSKASVHQMLDWSIVSAPLAHIPKDVYKTSLDWIGLKSIEALEPFVLWLSDQIFAEISRRTSKKFRQHIPSKPMIDIFVVLAMILRRKPDVLINLLPVLRKHPKYRAKDSFPVTIWMIVQGAKGDLVIGLFMWIHFLLPVLKSNKANRNSRSKELVLQLLERILSSPKSRSILLSRAVQKNEPLVPPSTLDFFMRLTYPTSSARVEATKRFKAVYPAFKEIALNGGSERYVVTQEILNFAIIAAEEGVTGLSREATDIFIRCLTQSPECYNHWDRLYLDNVEASVVILRKLSDELKAKSAKDLIPEPLKETLKSFRQKNAKARGETEDGGRKKLLRDADELCKEVLGQVSKSYGFVKAMLIVSALSAAILSLNVVNRNL